MPEEDQEALSARLAALPAGSVIAAAGCGKTEQIVLAVKAASGRRLILTHTHAGVDAIRKRLIKHGVPSGRYQLDTIASWCLRYAHAFPGRSALKVDEPKTGAEWRAVYEAAAKLIESGAVDGVLTASYSGLLVDEYQDCGNDQHVVVAALSKRLATCIFGDHLQAIFDFNDQSPVDWETKVLPQFPLAAELTKPWRWHKAGNIALADWLEKVRGDLEAGRPLDFRSGPVSYKWLPDQDGPRRGVIVGTCKGAMQLDGRLVVIGDPTNLEGRAQIAKGLAKQGFSNIEPVDCKSLFAAAKTLDKANDASRLDAVMGFLERCMIGLAKSEFMKAVAARKQGKQKGATKFGALIDLGVRIGLPGGERDVLSLVQAFRDHPETHLFRREMFFAMRSALVEQLAYPESKLIDALWEVQNRIRHAGRIISRRSVGSTLLVKGLEFEHAIIIHSGNMNRKDWYVALTRATHSVTVLAPQKVFNPPA